MKLALIAILALSSFTVMANNLDKRIDTLKEIQSTAINFSYLSALQSQGGGVSAEEIESIGVTLFKLEISVRDEDNGFSRTAKCRAAVSSLIERAMIHGASPAVSNEDNKLLEKAFGRAVDSCIK